MKYIFDRISELNYVITQKYFFYLLKNRNLENIFNEIKDLIIKFFIEQKNDKINKCENAEALISLLILSDDYNNKFRLDLLNQMQKVIIKEEEFHLKEETENFVLFKLFFEKCKDLLNIIDISCDSYLKESVSIKNRIYNNLKELKIKYDIIYDLIDKENSLYKKIFVIADEKEDEAKQIYDKIYDNFKKWEEKIKKFEKIEEF